MSPSPPPRPLVAILDGSIAMTGAVVAATRGARLLDQAAEFLLILPEASTVTSADLPPNMRLATLAMPALKRSLGGLLGYGPAVIASARRLHRLLDAEGASVLQVNDFYLLPGPMVRPLGWRGRIVTLIRIDVRRFGLPGRLWLAAARRWSDRLIAVSQFIRGIAGEPGPEVIYDPVPPVEAAPGELGGQRVLFVGNYIEGKGQDCALRAFQRIADRFPAAELHFHGGDMGLAKNQAYRVMLEARAADGPGADRIAFHGFAHDLAPLYAEAAIALVLSHSESFSFTCQEASARGRAVIATRCGGPEEIIDDGETGFLVDVDDDAAVAERMALLLGDPDRALAMGRRGADLMKERFSPDRWRNAISAALGLPSAEMAR